MCNWLPLTRSLLGTQSATQTCALPGNQTSNLWVCRLVFNPLSHTSQNLLPPFHLSSQLSHLLQPRACWLSPLGPFSFLLLYSAICWLSTHDRSHTDWIASGASRSLKSPCVRSSFPSGDQWVWRVKLKKRSPFQSSKFHSRRNLAANFSFFSQVKICSYHKSFRKS